MRIVVLHEAKKDMKWWRHYYKRTFPAGQLSASIHLQNAVELLAGNPKAGKEIEGTSLRQIPINRTPFLIIYRLTVDELQIVRLWDGRQDPKRKVETTEQ
jgi:plasmid stabilization system protein ParE